MLSDIQSEHVAMFLSIFLHLIHCSVCPFPHTIGIAVGMKLSFKDGLNYIAECMMYHSISKWGSAYFPSFGFVNEKVMVLTRLVVA